MAIITKENLKTIFQGISSVRHSKDVIATIATADWDYEFPVLDDSFNFAQADGTLNSLKVFGSAAAWTISGGPGDFTIEMTLPTVHNSLMEYFYEKTSSELTSPEETLNAVAGNYKGNGYFLTAKMISGSFMILSTDKKNALFIREAKGYPSLIFDNPIAKPIAIKLSLQLVGGHTESDIALLTFTKKD